MSLGLVLGLLGLVELLFPRRTVDCWMGLASAEGSVELRPWVYTAARLEGLVLLVWAVVIAGRPDG